MVIALSAALFGGEEAAWWQVVPVFGIGLLPLFCPLRRLPNRTVLIELVGLVCTGLLAFLPSRWFGEPEWHRVIRQVVPGMANAVSLQPWHSFLSFGLMLSVTLFAGLDHTMAAMQPRPSSQDLSSE